MIVFSRRVAVASACKGTNWLSSWIVAIVRLPCGSSPTASTLPTDTPATLTSAWAASSWAYGNDTWTR